MHGHCGEETSRRVGEIVYERRFISLVQASVMRRKNKFHISFKFLIYSSWREKKKILYILLFHRKNATYRINILTRTVRTFLLFTTVTEIIFIRGIYSLVCVESYCLFKLVV